MSSSSPFRIEDNSKYRWPPETVSPNAERLYDRTTHVYGRGEPKLWMKNYVAGTIIDFVLGNYSKLVQALSTQLNTPQYFPLDNEWWRDQLAEAEFKDIVAEEKNAIRAREDADFIVSKRRKPLKQCYRQELYDMGPHERVKRYLRALPDIKRDVAAARGTDVHKIAEGISKGQEVFVPDHLAGYVRSAVSFFDAYQPRFLEVESVIYSDRFGYGGQFDFLAEFDVARLGYLGHDIAKYGDQETIVVMGDYKTGEVRDGIVLQFSGYYFGDFIGRVDGSKDPIPHVDEFWGVHLGDDKCNITKVTVNDETFAYFLAARELGFWCDDKKGFLSKAINVPVTADVPELVAL